MPSDRIQRELVVGDQVAIIGTITAFGGTSAKPTVFVTTKYAGFDGSTDAMAEIDCIQVIKDQSVPRS